MSGLKRQRGRSLEERVWHWLRRQNDAVRLSHVMAEFSVGHASASNCLRRLVHKHSAVRLGRTVSVHFKALPNKPEDMRGTSVNTLHALQMHSAARRLSKAVLVHHLPPRYRRRVMSWSPLP